MGPQIPQNIQSELDKLRLLIEVVNGNALSGISFVLDESSSIYTTPAPNVFRTWATLYAAASKVAGPRLVEVVGVGHLTGTANIDEMMFLGTKDGALMFQSGASISFNTVYLSNIAWFQNGGAVAPLQVVGGAAVQMFMKDFSEFVGSATAPFANITGASTFNCDAQELSFVGDGTNTAVQTTGGAATFNFTGRGASQVLPKAIAGNGTFGENLDDGSPFFAQATFTGTRNIVQIATLPYAASLSASIAQSIPSGVGTQVTLAGVDYALGGEESPFTAWTAPAPNVLSAPTVGLYKISGFCGFPSFPAGANEASLAILVNGSIARSINYQIAAAARALSLEIVCQLQLNHNDQIGLLVGWSGAGGSQNTDVTAGANPQLQAALVR